MEPQTSSAHSSAMLNATDSVLLAAMEAGQVEALRELYRRYGALVYSLAWRILKTQEEAEDLTQEIFLKLWQKNTYQVERGSVSTYLSLTTRSRAIDRVRSRGAQYRVMQRWDLAHASLAPTNVPLEQATMGEQSQRVKQALSELSPAEKEILEIAYYEGLSQSQIAKRLELPLGTVKSRSRQALKKLRFKLKDLTG
ncbi:MAG: sigma-70 family RNA polymerase sigma factor [Cyanobacteria bacterium J06638_28]